MDTGLSETKHKLLAENCKAARLHKCMSAEELAARLGKSPSYIYKLEKAALNPPLAVLLSMRDILGYNTLRPFIDGL